MRIRAFCINVLVVVCLFLFIGVFTGWVLLACEGTRHMTPTLWMILVGGSMVFIGSLLALFWVVRFHPPEKDLAPDYLFHLSGGQTYFNRQGFVFLGHVRTIDGVAYIECGFQNQRDVPSTAWVVFRPTSGFFAGRPRIKTLRYEIDSAPGAFGIARLAIPIDPVYQGKPMKFEVGATVHYPQGKGKLLRFSEGIGVRTDDRFHNTFGTVTMVLGLLGGSVVISKPAFFTVTLPTGVLDELPVESPLEVETWWKLGDPPLESAGAAANPATT